MGRAIRAVGRQIPPTDGNDRPSLAAARTARHDVASTQELYAAGLSHEEIRHLAVIGFLHHRHRGVWAVGRPEVSFAGACRAAVLACGPNAAVSHVTAAVHDGYREWSGPIHVSGPRSLEGHPGLIVHRPRSLPEDEIVQRDGVGVTCVGRTLLDMSPQTPIETIGRWIHEAQVQRVFDRQEAWAVLERHPHHRGARRLEAALALEFAPTRSGLEDAFLPIVRRARMPRPLVNSDQWSGERWDEVDFCWPALGLIVEVDGGRYHASRWRRRRDAAKDDRFRAVGWTVWRVPELAITCDAAGTARHLATLGRGNRSGGRILRPTGTM